jgi:hypothetical protein
MTDSTMRRATPERETWVFIRDHLSVDVRGFLAPLYIPRTERLSAAGPPPDSLPLHMDRAATSTNVEDNGAKQRSLSAPRPS